MARMPGAVWDPLAANYANQTRMRAHDIICIHTMVGSLEGTDSLFRHTNGAGYAGTESHFGTGYDGRIEQWQDTDFQADANYNGSWHIISIENADYGTGFPRWNTSNGAEVPAFTDAQIEANAQIIAWACRTHGIPCELIPDARPGRRGVGYHRQGVPGFMVAGAEQWSTARGKVCPGDRRIAQIPQIIERARQILNGDDMPTAREVAIAVLDETRSRQGGQTGPASLGGMMTWNDAKFAEVNANIKAQTEIIRTLAAARPNEAIDVDALMARIDQSIEQSIERSLAEGVNVDVTVGGQATGPTA